MDGNWLVAEMLPKHLSCCPNAKYLASFYGTSLLSKLILFSALKSSSFFKPKLQVDQTLLLCLFLLILTINLYGNNEQYSCQSKH